jgi:hypothetical protein
MFVAKSVLRLVVCCALVSPLGCGDEPEHAGDDHVHEGSATDVVPCGENFPSFRAGLSAPAGDLTVRLISIDPEPARQQQDNDWVIEVVDARGAPVPAAVIENVDTWMDVHKHGGRWEPDVERLAEPGRFAFKHLDFKMAGPWRVRFGVKATAAATAARTSLPICVE